MNARWMRLALGLAALGRGRVEPNPLVGCVIVADGVEVGRGYHVCWGGPHAEVVALARAGAAARGATVYVTLEPCGRAGKTPPCADALIEAGVGRVIFAAGDPDGRTTGRGPVRLREAGIPTEGGLLADEARALNRRFERHLAARRPWTILKWGASLDGRVADVDGGSKYVTGPSARRLVHRLRAAVDAIVVGVGTVLADDPRLDCRGVEGGSSPHRIVFDRRLRTPAVARVVRSAAEIPTTLVHGPDVPVDARSALEEHGVRFLAVPLDEAGQVDVTAAAERLFDELGARRLLLEGGPTLAGSWLRARAVDQVLAFAAPKILGGASALGPVGGAGVSTVAEPLALADATARRVGADLLFEGFLD